jgi:hypothetical protein
MGRTSFKKYYLGQMTKLECNIQIIYLYIFGNGVFFSFKAKIPAITKRIRPGIAKN